MLLCAAVEFAPAVAAPSDDEGMPVDRLGNLVALKDPSGLIATFSTHGVIDRANPFFQNLGVNGRRCATCHRPAEGWTVTPRGLRARFEATQGRDPIFRPIDGAGCPDLDVSTLKARRQAYAPLLRKGLVRVPMKVRPGAEFSVVRVDNPYGCARQDELSVYRRPLPSTNLPFLSAVMWDGRGMVKDAQGSFKTIREGLAQQAIDATLGHAEGVHPLSAKQVKQIVDFEMGLFTSQIFDRKAGWLDRDGALGGPARLSRQAFFLGINDPLGGNPTGAAFSPTIFTLFGGWEQDGARARDRLPIIRGERLFNTLPIAIKGVAGLNDDLGVPVIEGFCGTCHDAPNVGDHSLPAPLDIGLATAARRTADLPLITLRNNATGTIVRTSDPGRALVTGKWADISRFKGPILRGLAARAPYFHNGAAATLADVVDFYDQRFKLRLTAQDKADLAAFLSSL
jgi:hypothetical protein